MPTSIFGQQIVQPLEKQFNWIIQNNHGKTPLTRLLNANSGMHKDYSLKWEEWKPCPPLYLGTDLSASGSTATTAIVLLTEPAASLSGEAFYGAQYADVYKIDNELILVTADPTFTARSGTTNGYTTLGTITRGAFSTTAATHSQYAKVYYAGSARLTDATFNNAETEYSRHYTEYMARMYKEVKLDTFDVYMGAKSSSAKDGATREKMAKTAQMAVMTEGALFHAKAATPTTGTKFGMFNGLLNQTTEVSTIDGSSYTTSGITIDQFNSVLGLCEERNGGRVDLIIVPSRGWMRKALNDWYADKIVMTQDNGKNLGGIGGSWMPNLVMENGPIDIMVSQHIPVGTVLFLRKDLLKLYYGTRPFLRDCKDIGGGPRYMVEAHMVLQVTNQPGQMKITDLTGYA